MELLLTGSTGFVGRNLLPRLNADERWSRIYLPVRDPEKLRVQLAGEGIEVEALEGRIQIIKVAGNTWELPSRVHPDLMIHAAGRLFGREREEYFQTNVQGSLNLAAQLPGHTRVIVLSSLAAGGPTPEGVNARNTQMVDTPVSLYGDSKLAMEKALMEMLVKRLLILRPPMVLGPRDTATVPLFQMAKGVVRVKPGFLPKNYSWIAVEDLCEAIVTVAFADWESSGPYYLTAEEVITDNQLISTAAEVIDARGITLPIPQTVIRLASLILDSVSSWREAVPSLGRDRVREILPDRWVCDGSDFQKVFHWKPHRELSGTLRATAEWLGS